MRFKKGTVVEVLSEKEFPSGSWRCAEVVSGNGHTITVRYNLDTSVSNESTVEMVSRKSTRPCPPLVDISENWAPGDVLEVFQNFSWKMAIICKALGRNEFLVRLAGFSNEFRVCRSDLRVRQSWHDGKWFLIGKQTSSQVTRTERKTNPNSKGDFCAPRNKMDLSFISLINRKRGFSYAHSEVEVSAKKARKFELHEKASIPQRFPEKVATNDEDNITCSVGSCSNDLFKSSYYFSKGPIDDDECSDAESVCYGDFDENNYLPTQKKCDDEIRRLELQAYRCTMEALHACGPLSWEQETLVTNLRLSLNISNDQHLMELRHLISTATSLAFR